MRYKRWPRELNEQIEKLKEELENYKNSEISWIKFRCIQTLYISFMCENMDKIITKEKSLINLRACVRYDFQKEIEYTISHANNQQILKGIVINIGGTGIGLYVFNPLIIGQEIFLITDIGELNRKGRICWCKELGDNVYKVGVKFI